MSSPITNVAILGAGGNLGVAVLKAFLSSPNFIVTVITRPESQSTFSPEVNIVKSEYSLGPLTAALVGQHAVLALVGDTAFASQQVVVDAAIAAGVKRFVPSEFGSDTASPAVHRIVPFLDPKRQLIEYLRANESAISWTGVITGPWLDWGLKFKFLGFDIPARTAQLWDGGETRFAATNVHTIASALVALLSKDGYKKTENQYVYLASCVTTQKEILASLERATGTKFEVTAVATEQAVTEAKKKMAQGEDSGAVDLLRAATIGKEGLAGWTTMWNERLGLPSEDIDETVKAVVESKAP